MNALKYLLPLWIAPVTGAGLLSAQMERIWIRSRAARPTGTRRWMTSIRVLRQASSRPKRTWKARRSRCRMSLPVRYATCAAGPWSSKVGKYGKFLACSGFPECRGTKRLVKGYRRHLPPSAAKGRMLERKKLQGPHLLWLRALPGLRLYDMGHAGAHQVPQVRQHHVPQRLQAVLRKGRLRLRDAGAEKGLKRIKL